MNKVVLVGRLTKEPDVRYSQSEQPIAVARYTIAVNRKSKKEGEQEADFVSCVAFGKQGEFAEKYLHKGMKIAISGRIQTGSYEKDGQKFYTTDVVVEEHEFCESKGTVNNSSPSQQVDGNGFMSIPDGLEAELPFK